MLPHFVNLSPNITGIPLPTELFASPVSLDHRMVLLMKEAASNGGYVNLTEGEYDDVHDTPYVVSAIDGGLVEMEPSPSAGYRMKLLPKGWQAIDMEQPPSFLSRLKQALRKGSRR